MKLDVLNFENNKVDSLEVAGDIFTTKPHKEAVLQYLRVYLANQRQGTASTKTRAEVSGGGKKPWKQKGTGRARQGSIRSPIWRHGGVAFGPKPKDYSLTVPKKVVELAFKSVLSEKYALGSVLVLDMPKFDKPGTKKALTTLKNLGITKEKVLFVWSENDENLLKSLGNIANVQLAYSGNMNAYQILNVKKVILSKNAVKVLENRYASK